MVRIPEAGIERLKNEVSVERLVEASGIASANPSNPISFLQVCLNG